MSRVLLCLAGLFCLGAVHAGAAAADNLANAIHHSPANPLPNQAVSVAGEFGTAVTAAVLRIQVVEPGAYIRRTDAAYTNASAWQEFPMQRTGAGRFEATIPPQVQQHRRLIRYIVAVSESGGSVRRWPSATNECPNFAYFVYGGIPAWTGASRPGRTPALNFSAEFMKTLPAYQLIASRSDVEQSQWNGDANRRRFFGTFVYDGRVYDHMQFHNRGKASTYVSGKNKWGFKFNDDQPFHDRDLWGRPMSNTVKSVSLTACASPWAQVNRGMAGMDEAVSFRAYLLAGVPSADTHWIQLRVISGQEEAPAENQYGGDLWGLYQVVQEPGGEWLKTHGWADGEIYSPETGVKHRPKGAPTNDVAFQRFMQGPRGAPPEAWWRTNLDLPRYYSFHALNRVLGNVDLRPGANHYLYHEADGRWCVVPWDLDMMFIAKTHQPGFVDQARCLEVPALKREFQARAREILDLFCADTTANGGQIGQLVEEMRGSIAPAGFDRTWAELDMCLWNYHPRSHARGHFYLNPCEDGRFGGNWTRRLATPDFAGFCRYIVDYCSDSRPVKNYAINDGDQRGYGFGYLTIEAKDERIPAQPVVTAVNMGKAIFEVSPFVPGSRVGGGAFAAVQWRAGEISGPGMAGYTPGTPRKYEIEEFWRSPEITTATNRCEISAPFETGHTYRVRARYKDTAGRWSRWSGAAQWVEGKR